MYSVRRGVLRLHRPPSTDLRFLCWPVLVYRVTAPVIRVRYLDLFEKVILALCRAGVRQPGAIALMIHQDRDLVEHVMGQLRAAGRLDSSGAPTTEGQRTSDTGRLDEEPELIVTHVFQDPFSGDLWPRATPDLVYQPVQRVQDGRAHLQLYSHGHPRPETALVVEPERTRVSQPTAEQVIAAIRDHRSAQARQRAEQFASAPIGSTAGFDAQQQLRALNSALSLPGDHDVRRVVDVRDPVQDYLLVWLEPEAGEGSGWRARDPFGLDPSPMLQQRVAARMRQWAPLAADVSGLAKIVDNAQDEAYRKAGERVRQSRETKLVELLGAEIRLHPGMLHLLVGLEDAAARAPEPSALESVVREAFRTYEHLFRRLVGEYPPPRPRWIRTSPASDLPPNRIIRDHIDRYANELGFTGVPFGALGGPRGIAERLADPLGESTNLNLDRAFIRDLIPHALTAAADQDSPHRAKHPLRGLAKRRPAILTELFGRLQGLETSTLRNRGSHGERDATISEDIEWCRGLALDAGKTVLDMPPQSTGRIAV